MRRPANKVSFSKETLIWSTYGVIKEKPLQNDDFPPRHGGLFAKSLQIRQETGKRLPCVIVCEHGIEYGEGPVVFDDAPYTLPKRSCITVLFYHSMKILSSDF